MMTTPFNHRGYILLEFLGLLLFTALLAVELKSNGIWNRYIRSTTSADTIAIKKEKLRNLSADLAAQAQSFWGTSNITSVDSDLLLDHLNVANPNILPLAQTSALIVREIDPLNRARLIEDSTGLASTICMAHVIPNDYMTKPQLHWIALSPDYSFSVTSPPPAKMPTPANCSKAKFSHAYNATLSIQHEPLFPATRYFAAQYIPSQGASAKAALEPALTRVRTLLLVTELSSLYLANDNKLRMFSFISNTNQPVESDITHFKIVESRDAKKQATFTMSMAFRDPSSVTLVGEYSGTITNFFSPLLAWETIQ